MPGASVLHLAEEALSRGAASATVLPQRTEVLTAREREMKHRPVTRIPALLTACGRSGAHTVNVPLPVERVSSQDQGPAPTLLQNSAVKTVPERPPNHEAVTMAHAQLTETGETSQHGATVRCLAEEVFLSGPGSATTPSQSTEVHLAWEPWKRLSLVTNNPVLLLLKW